MGQCVADAGGFPSNPGIGRTDVVRRKRLLSVTVRNVEFWGFFCFLSQIWRMYRFEIFWMFFRSLFQNIVGFILLAWRTFIHHLWWYVKPSILWVCFLLRRFALLPQQTEDELAISEACQNLLALHDIIFPYISQIPGDFRCIPNSTERWSFCNAMLGWGT